MRYAAEISEMMNAFSPEPLRADQMEEFYCGDTMEYRMSDKYSSPLEDILDACRGYGEGQAFLLLGHRGCGKSTELNLMSAKLAEDGYPVKTIACSMDLDMFNIVYSDLFILMGEALLEMAKDAGCRIKGDVLEDIANFWAEGTETVTSHRSESAKTESELGVKTPDILQNILNVFVKMKADLKFNEETRKEYRSKISVRSSEWIGLLNEVAQEISGKTQGKLPVMIFEDLDKLNPEDAWKVFYHYAAILSGMSFPVIYTFPIALSYDPRFSAMEGYFVTKTLPMIKIETIEGRPFAEGIRVVQEIVSKRAKLDLFEKDALEAMIRYTGGSLRDLFAAINASAKRAYRRKSGVISMEDAERALEELRTGLTRRIERKEYDFLLDICRGNKELIEDKEMLLKMLQASVVLEYNGKRWHNVHPLVKRFFEEQGMLGRTAASC